MYMDPVPHQAAYTVLGAALRAGRPRVRIGPRDRAGERLGEGGCAMPLSLFVAVVVLVVAGLLASARLSLDSLPSVPRPVPSACREGRLPSAPILLHLFTVPPRRLIPGPSAIANSRNFPMHGSGNFARPPILDRSRVPFPPSG